MESGATGKMISMEDLKKMYEELLVEALEVVRVYWQRREEIDSVLPLLEEAGNGYQGVENSTPRLL